MAQKWYAELALIVGHREFQFLVGKIMHEKTVIAN